MVCETIKPSNCHNHSLLKLQIFHVKTYLQRLEAAHAAAADAPHEAESLDPVVSGHGGVPHSPAPVIHAESQAHAGKQGGDPGQEGDHNFIEKTTVTRRRVLLSVC